MPAELLSESYLLQMMSENLNQARHAENERMMFVTLFAALVGGVLAIISEMDNPFFASVTIILLAVLNVICHILTQRWNNVFKAHWHAAQQIGCYLADYSPQNGYVPDFRRFQDSAFWQQYGARINRYFCFDNSRNAHGKTPYIHTSTLFACFNRCIFILLALAFIYVNLDGLQQIF